MEHTYQDIDFAKKMVLVNQQAMQIASVAIQKASDARVKNLASEIYDESKASSEKYTGWLTQWKESYLNLSDFPETEGHDTYPTFSGMMKLTEVQRLEAVAGSEFDSAFLELMVKHHEAVIELQTGKTSEGAAVKYGDILKLLQENARRHKEQVYQMRQLQKEKL